jgi:Ca2+-binding RTX toxin-like protein
MFNFTYSHINELAKIGMKMVMNHFSLDLRFVSLMTVVTLAIFYSLTTQITWAALIICKSEIRVCNGTPSADIIFGYGDDNIIHGLAGNDFIIGSWPENNFIYGDDGDDTLVGGYLDDFLQGGRGNDKYDGLGGADSVLDAGFDYPLEFYSGDDIISGSSGDDWVNSGGGADTIHGGPGNDFIYPNTIQGSRDFSHDLVDCGSGNDKIEVSSSEDSSRINCEDIRDNDG